MKYIKLFEDFTEQFDYKIEDIKAILNKRNIDFNDIKYIDSGGYGSAFDLDNGYVVKITNMNSEVYYAKKLVDINSEYLVKVKDVFFHEYFDVGYTVKVGFIIMEKLDMNGDNRFKRFVDYLNIKNPITSIYKSVKNEEVLEYFDSKLIGMDTETILSYWKMYKNILLECEKYNLPIDDLRGRNIGFRDDNPVFFDIGDIHSSYQHDYSNIDILDYDIINI